MPIPEVSQVRSMSPSVGRWVAAARASRRPPRGSAPASAEPAYVNPGYDGGADDASEWAPRQDMTLAGVVEAYSSV